jgi:hypothetical protein
MSGGSANYMNTNTNHHQFNFKLANAASAQNQSGVGQSNNTSGIVGSQVNSG